MTTDKCYKCSGALLKTFAFIPPGGQPLLFCSTECRSFVKGGFMSPGRNNAAAGVISSGPQRRGRRHDRPVSQSELRRKMRPKETDVSKSIANRLDGAGVWHTRTQSGQVQTKSGHTMTLCRKGTPDRLFADGVVVWIEVKRSGETARPDQVAAIDELRRNGSLVFVLDDPDDLTPILAGLKRRRDRLDFIARSIAEIQGEISEDLIEHRRKAGRGSE